MDVPGIVESALEGEDIAAEVSLGGENVLYVTPSRTLIYQSEGFLSDESVDEYPHNAQRMTVKEGRRKTRLSLEYSLDGTEEFTVPSNATDDVLHPVLAGVLNASGVTDPDETVTRTFRLDELTLVITSERLVKHVGSAVWDEDYEEYHFADVTGLDFEDGSVATQLVLTVDGRPERMKVSNERAAEVKEYLQRSLFSYYGVNSLDALNEAVAPAETDEADEAAAVDFGEGVDPLDAGNTVQPEEGEGPVEPGPPADQPVENQLGGAGSAAGDDPGQPPTGQSQVGQPEADQPPAGQQTRAGADEPAVDGTRTEQPEQGESTQQSQPPQSTEPAGEARTEQQSDGADAVTEAVERTSEDELASMVEETASDAYEAAGGTESTPQPESPHKPESTPADGASGVDEPVGAAPDADETDEEVLSDSKFAEAGFQPATAAGDEELLERIETLESKVEHQNELLQRQHDLLQQLVDELSRSQ
ncbi:DUF7115 domain-containing protein [Haloarchaeobius iranensis]|uniref:DUF7115 domain-containing protein n=1 Tax=Haloarchaeobius iranensis TaxID=996166 RepID=A0A1G9X5L2_9EURY|nr:hypothetical protein [Haloarchaeobius iranensis]SDM91806.1 hypothetical protein SAMN05192554_109157 [Haloarchaeobius iranensis]